MADAGRGPGLPAHRFLEFWRRDIDAVIHSVTIGGVELIGPAKMRNVQYVGQLH